MRSETSEAIVLEHVGKRYLLNLHKPDALKTAVLHLPSVLNGRQRWPFWALDDISLTIRKGESVGIIGPNGSGKSTLLRVMSRISPPTRGKVTVQGRVSALLELGSGFHPQISGRENAILNAVLLGLSLKEARERMPEIVEFSELGDFIDQPMRTYSSGMYVRLGFSVAVHVRPRILLVDEVLAVGDAEFQSKCFAHIDKLRAENVTIVLVSHDLWSVARFCDRVVLLDQGHIAMDGAPQPVIHEYLSRIALLVNLPTPVTSSDLWHVTEGPLGHR
jgi:lipopolysaccharide transport system ATP-binding protein